MKTLYISDLDGTLLNNQAMLSDFSRENLKNLINDGLMFTVATARTKATVKDIFSGVGLNQPWVLMNGVLIYDPLSNVNIAANEISIDDAESVLSAYKRYNKTPMLYFLKDDHLEIQYQTIYNVYQKEYIESRKNLIEKRFKKIEDDFKINKDDKLIYIVSLDKEDILAPICEEIRAENRVYCAFYSDNYTDCSFMECMNKAVSKGVAAERLKSILKVDRIIAFGDNLNDLPLFNIADECYAVSNACQQLKDAATGIIDSNCNDGVVKFIMNHYNTKE
ncbi:MAG: HAD-IIB family hydrolase [Clostridia bacterium]|nr:HAD-IIB family hydrolase [Clostridia bacterium]